MTSRTPTSRRVTIARLSPIRLTGRIVATVRMTSANMRAEPGNHERSLLLGGERVRRKAAQPDGHGQDEDRGRPRHRIEDVTRVAERRLEEVGSVADEVDRVADGHQDPWRLAPSGHHRRATDDQKQQQQVSDRIGEVRDGLGGAATGQVQHGWEEERCTQRCRRRRPPPRRPTNSASPSGAARHVGK